MKIRQTLLIMIVLTGMVFAQGKFTDFKIGILMPSDAKTGFLGSLSFGRMVDNNIGYAFEIGYYGRTYTKETPVATSSGQINTTTIVTEIENATTMLPVYFLLNYTSQVSGSLDLRFTGGIGYELMWNSETNHLSGVDKSRFYSGFTWQLGAGVSFPLSRASDLFAEAVYHSGNPSRDEGTTDLGLPVRTEVDMSGLIFRVGLRLFTFGF